MKHQSTSKILNKKSIKEAQEELNHWHKASATRSQPSNFQPFPSNRSSNQLQPALGTWTDVFQPRCAPSRCLRRDPKRARIGLRRGASMSPFQGQKPRRVTHNGSVVVPTPWSYQAGLLYKWSSMAFLKMAMQGCWVITGSLLVMMTILMSIMA